MMNVYRLSILCTKTLQLHTMRYITLEDRHNICLLRSQVVAIFYTLSILVEFSFFFENLERVFLSYRELNSLSSHLPVFTDTIQYCLSPSERRSSLYALIHLIYSPFDRSGHANNRSCYSPVWTHLQFRGKSGVSFPRAIPCLFLHNICTIISNSEILYQW